ncbi:MAG: alpha-amylase family glycosyl hydrolase, partial [Planctomycetota bacterium]
ELGCDALWLNPCFTSPFQDAGYDVSDFYSIAPRYGTNEDLRRLVEEAGRRGMRVLLDLVAGHTSVEHPWFKASCGHGPNRYSNWYIWTNTPWRLGDGYNNLIRGYAERPGCYMPNYFWFQPALNYGFARVEAPWQLPVDHPDVQAVRAELQNIMRFWLDMGVAGFRVDMAQSLVKNDEDWRATTELWRGVRAMLDHEYPGTVLVAEWSSPRHALAAGFDLDFMLSHGGTYGSVLHFDCEARVRGETPQRHGWFRRAGQGDICAFLDEFRAHYRAVDGGGHIALISGNHDIYRLALDRTRDELAVCFAFLLTMPGVPFIYYGDEIGMDYRRGLVSKEGGYERTGSRTPMRWTPDAPNLGFSTAPAEKLYLPVDGSPAAPTVAAQQGRAGSLLEIVRALLALRRATPALWADGDFAVLHARPGEYPFVFQRIAADPHGASSGERIVVALNPAERPVTLNVDVPATAARVLMAERAALALSDGTAQLAMRGVSFGIFAVS